MFGFGALICLLMMMFVQWSNCCCNVDTGEQTCRTMSSNTSTGCITGETKDLEFRCDDETVVKFHDLNPLSHNVTVQCIDGASATVRFDQLCSPVPAKCSCEPPQVLEYICTYIISTPPTTTSQDNKLGTSTTADTKASTQPTMLSENVTPSQTSQPNVTQTMTMLENFANLPPSQTSQPKPTQPNNVDTVSILLSIIILLMALFICAILTLLIAKRVKKQKLGHRYRVNNENLVQENVYQDVGNGNRRPSRIIPITTYDGQHLELSEFPRYDLGNSHKLSNTSLTKQCDKGGFLKDKIETSGYFNGFPPCEEHFYSTIPANNDHKPPPEGYSSQHHSVSSPQAVAPLSTCSSDASLVTDPYSTLNEARKQAVREMKSKHTEGHADDVLKLNVFGNDTPKWNHDTCPLQLNIPTTYRSRATSGGRLSLEEEEAYIQMAGDLEGGWGEQWVHHHAGGFGTTNEHHDRAKLNGLGDSYTFENQHYASATQIRSQSLEQLDGSYLMSEEAPPLPQRNYEGVLITDRPLEAPPTPDWNIEAPPLPDRNNETSPILDRSIEDLYAKVRKKSKKVNESSDSDNDDTVVVINDNYKNPQSHNNSCGTEYMSATMQDSLMSQGGLHTQVPASSTLMMIEKKHLDMQVSVESKHGQTDTHTQ